MDKKIDWTNAIETEKEKKNKGFFEYLFTNAQDFDFKKEKSFLLNDLNGLNKIQIYKMVNQILPERKRNIETFEVNLNKTIKNLLSDSSLNESILEILLYIQDIYTTFKLSRKMGEYSLQIEEYKKENKCTTSKAIMDMIMYFKR